MNLFFVCPLCGNELHQENKSLICKNRHCFDIAKEGYTNLMPSSKHSHVSGDNLQMVKSRQLILQNGYYSNLLNAIKVFLKNQNRSLKILDIGCGEGYLTRELSKELSNCKIGGIDISKPAIMLASKLCKNCSYAVANATHLPVADKSLDAVINSFAPVTDEELDRTIKRGGYVLKIVPNTNHLWNLKEALYDTAKPNPKDETTFKGFSLIDEIEIDDKFVAKGDEIFSLMQMTPYFYKTAPEAIEKVAMLPQLETNLSFLLKIFQKQ